MSPAGPISSEIPLVDRFQRVCPTHGIKLTGSGDLLDCRYGHQCRVHSVLDTTTNTIVGSSDIDDGTERSRKEPRRLETSALDRTRERPPARPPGPLGRAQRPPEANQRSPHPAPTGQRVPQPADAASRRRRWKVRGLVRFIEP